MASFELPENFDAVILGSGMTECILAAALSRIGYNVLHMDRNDYYSGDSACFNWKSLQDWIHAKQFPKECSLQAKDVDLKALLKEDEKTVDLKVNSYSVTDLKAQYFVRPKPVENTEDSKNLVNQTLEPKPVENTEDSKTLVNQTLEESPKQIDREDEDATDCQVEKNKTDSATEEKTVENTAEVQPEKSSKKIYFEEDLTAQWRKFNLDLMPKVLYCRGPMVELLISSDVAKYLEFKALTRVLTWVPNASDSGASGRLERVPCSRADVFSSKQVSMIEKRMMMKFLQFSIDYTSHPDEYHGYESRPFSEFIRSKKLTENVIHYIQHAIAMVNETATTLEGLERCQRFLQSLGRYGNTAFLWPMYGSGEMPQCFCRMSAVFGGCYCLRRTATKLIVDKHDRCTGIIDTEGQRISCKWLIMEASYSSEEFITTADSNICNDSSKTHPEQPYRIERAIFITSQSVLSRDNVDAEDITLISFPRQRASCDHPITVYELGPSTYACPVGMHVVHFTCRVNDNHIQEDFEELKKRLFQQSNTGEQHNDTKPEILWELYFEVADSNQLNFTSCPSEVYIVPGPDGCMDFDASISKAREIFDQLCPGQEFLPKAPNPEDIIWSDEAPRTDTGFDGSQSDDTTVDDSSVVSDQKPESTQEAEDKDAEHKSNIDNGNEESGNLSENELATTQTGIEVTDQGNILEGPEQVSDDSQKSEIDDCSTSQISTDKEA